MRLRELVLILVAFWTRPAVADWGPPGVHRDPLPSWLEDDEILRVLKTALGGSEYPLEVAYAAAIRTPSVPKIAFSCLKGIAHALTSSNLFTMLDASVKFPFGLMYGSLTHLGHWDECVDIRDQKLSKNGTVFHGQMCLLNIGAKYVGSRSGTGNKTVEEKSLRSFSPQSSSLYLRLGTCVPSSCTHGDVETLFDLIFTLLPVVDDVRLGVTVNKEDCSTRDDKELDTSDWVAVAILSFLALLVVLSTGYDSIVPPEKKQNIFVAFSVLTNGRKLLAVSSSGSDSSLSCLHGLRVISMCWIVLGHRHELSMLLLPNINSIWIQEQINTWYRVYVTNASVSVDTFFFMSGLLVAYLFFKQQPSSRHLNLPKYYIHRYVRLTPVLAFVVLFQATIMMYFGSGPLWPSLSSYSQLCRDNWWSTLIYVANHVNPTTMCVEHSWYLMVDMQLYWLAPIVILTLAKSPRIGTILIVVLTAAGLATTFSLTMIYDLPGVELATMPDSTRKIWWSNLYIGTYSRFIPYLQGIGLGYVLGTRKALGEKFNPLSIVQVITAWVLIAALLLVPVFLGYIYLKEPAPPTVSAAFFNSIHRPAWTTGLALLVYLCAAGNGGPVNTLLSWPLFQILGRLSYSLYLIHIPWIVIQTTSVHTYTYLSDSVLLSNYASDLMISLVFAVIMNLVFEFPFLAIEKELLGGRLQKTRKTESAP